MRMLAEITDDLSRLWEIEAETHGDQVKMSEEDEGVVKLWEDNVREVGGHYELPIPWKPGVMFPNNYVVAISRLRSLLRNVEQKQLTERYHAEIQKLLDQGYAEEVPETSQCTSTKVWY